MRHFYRWNTWSLSVNPKNCSAGVLKRVISEMTSDHSVPPECLTPLYTIDFLKQESEQLHEQDEINQFEERTSHERRKICVTDDRMSSDCYGVLPSCKPEIETMNDSDLSVSEVEQGDQSTDEHDSNSSVVMENDVLEDAKPYVCTICNKQFGRRYHLMTHERIHTGEKPFICNICNKGFSHSGNLNKHLKRHSPSYHGPPKREKNHFCVICNKGFRDTNALNVHQRIHSGEKPHICNICNKAFSDRRNLATHTRVHSGEKPYVCDICDKGFRQVGHLTAHLSVHTCEKLFSCDICLKEFGRAGALSKHKRIRRDYKCNLCNKMFCIEGDLTKHHKLYHPAFNSVQKNSSISKITPEASSISDVKSTISQNISEKLSFKKMNPKNKKRLRRVFKAELQVLSNTIEVPAVNNFSARELQRDGNPNSESDDSQGNVHETANSQPVFPELMPCDHDKE